MMKAPQIFLLIVLLFLGIFDFLFYGVSAVD